MALLTTQRPLPARRPCLFRIRDAEADGDGEIGMRANPGRHGDGIRDLGLHAGDAFARHIINEPRAALDDVGDPVFRGGRRNEVDIAQPGRAHQRLVGVRFLGREIQHQQAIHSRLGGVRDECLQTDPVDEIEIDVEHDRDLGVPPDGRHRFQHPGRGSAGIQAALGGQLVDQAIRQRIAERHAQLQHVHAGAVKGQRQLARRLQIRIPRADIDHNLFPAVALQPGKSFLNAIHLRRSVPLRLEGCKFGVQSRGANAVAPRRTQRRIRPRHRPGLSLRRAAFVKTAGSSDP